MVKQGSGTQILAGLANSWNNGTQINAGMLQLGPGASLGNATASGAWITASGGTLDLGGNSQAVAAAVTFAGGTVQDGSFVKAGADYAGQSGTVSANLNGSVGLTKTTAGTLTLSGTNAYAGNTTLNAGVVLFASPNAIGGSGASVTIAAGATAAPNYPLDSTFLNRINPASAGAVALTTASSAPLDFSANGANLPNVSLGAVGTQTYTGTITPANNTYLLGGVGGTLVLPNDQALTDGGASQSLVVNGNVILGGSNTFTGTTTISAGTLQLGSGGTDGSIDATSAVVDNATLLFNRADNLSFLPVISGSGGLTQAGPGTLILASPNTYTGTTTISGGTLQIDAGGTTGSLGTGAVNNNAALVFNRGDNISVGNLISGNGSLTQLGPGTLTLTAANTFTGNTLISGGALTLANASALQNSTLDTSGAGSLSFGGLTAATLGGLIGPGNLTLTNANTAAVTLTVGNNGQSTSYAGSLSGLGGLTKTGAGMLTLTGANSYSGTTLASGGTLNFAAGSSLVNSSIVDAVNGGVLTISGSLTVAPDGAFGVGSGFSGGTGTVILNSGAVVNIGGGDGTYVGRTYIGGYMDYTGAGGTGILTINGGILNVAAGGSVTTGDGNNFWMNPWGGGGTATLNLNGGTLSTARQITNGAGNNATVHFNGGVLQAAGNLNLIGGVTTAYVDAGGLILDSQAYSATINQALSHGTGAPRRRRGQDRRRHHDPLRQ